MSMLRQAPSRKSIFRKSNFGQRTTTAEEESPIPDPTPFPNAPNNPTDIYYLVYWTFPRKTLPPNKSVLSQEFHNQNPCHPLFKIV